MVMATTVEIATAINESMKNCIDGVYRIPVERTTVSTISVSTYAEDFTATYTEAPTSRGGGSSVSPVMLTIYTAVFFFGVVGNTLVIATLRSSPHMRTVTNCFLLSLAISDMLQALICIPISITGQALERFVFGSVMCKTFMFLMGISVSVSTFTMLAISLERYHAICKPLKSRGWQTKSHAYKVIGSIWLFSFLFMSPYFIFSQIKYHPISIKRECTVACRLNFGEHDAEAKKAWYVILVLMLFLLPGIMMTVSYLKVCRQIYKGFQFHAVAPPTQSSMSMKLLEKCETNDTEKTNMNENDHKYEKKSGLSIKQNLDVPHGNESGALTRQRSKAYQSKNQLESKKRIIRMLIVVVIFFFMCWAPLYIVNLWRGFDEAGAHKHVRSFISIIQLLSFISSCINPIIYCFMNLKFRQSFVKAFTCCLPQRCVACIQDAPAAQTTNNMERTMTSEVCVTPIMRRNPNTSMHRNATTSTASTTTLSRSTDQSFSSKASPGKSKSGYGQL